MHSEFGLIGKKLSHSFSKKYFENKFKNLGLQDHSYSLFEIESIQELDDLLRKHPRLKGLNVTIPFKNNVFEILDNVDPIAQRIGSVNVIKIQEDGVLKGYNTDYYGFHESLKKWIEPGYTSGLSALVFGSGGASKAVCCALSDLNIPFRIVSRKENPRFMNYLQLKGDPGQISSHKLIINTTPLGMYPQITSYPLIDYTQISSQHFMYDLVYNPEETLFMKKSQRQGATVKNGLEMLHLQAEKSWEIWSE